MVWHKIRAKENGSLLLSFPSAHNHFFSMLYRGEMYCAGLERGGN